MRFPKKYGPGRKQETKMSKEQFETFVKNTRGERFLKRTKTSMKICGENRLDLWLPSDFLRFLTTIPKERLN